MIILFQIEFIMDIATNDKWALEVSQIDSGIDLVETKEFPENVQHQMKKERIERDQANDHHKIINDVAALLTIGR